ncbi:hypothetical protein KXV79_008313 [Aspergillus fumigatus]|nr:hypothetical protein KXV79_008313 [Aspergillus fumigatus]
MDETTPLLPGQNDHNDEDTTATRLTRVSRIIAILIWSSIITSAVTFLYSLAVYLVVKLSLYYVFFSWGMRDTIEMLLPLLVRHLQADRPKYRRMALRQLYLRSVDRIPPFG